MVSAAAPCRSTAAAKAPRTLKTTGMSQISVAVSQVDTMTQRNAAVVEEAAAASEDLKHQAVL